VKNTRRGGTIVLGVYNSFARVPQRLRRVVARLSGYRWGPERKRALLAAEKASAEAAES